ncbi:putative bifunctional diguanylate cyclase/phosphodiesterase [Antrihabitans spumae]|uniref:Bifunctional diguanylate cyclase/phosphodiesterase n=1 Tax=Antrihabitans spumae TaxID=3373370 RepID=A0ABW7KHZ7_9NOCA
MALHVDKQLAVIWRAIARVASDGVIIATADGTIVEFNPIAERIFASSRSDVIGLKMIDVVVPANLRGPHRASVARFRASSQLPFERAFTFRTLGRRGDGASVPIEVTITATPGDDVDSGAAPEWIVAFIREPAEHDTRVEATPPASPVASEKHWMSGDQISEILGSAPLVVFSLDLDGIIRVATGGGLARMGVESDDLVGRNVFDLRPGREDLARIYRRAISGEKFRFRVEAKERVWDTHYQPLYSDEGELTGSLGVSIDVTAQVISEKALRLLAETDIVTGLGSRSHTEDSLAELLSDGEPLALLLIDLDDFKDINDSHGHAMGDRVLHRVGTRIRKTAPARSIIGRLGGDELVVGLRTADVDQAAAVASSIIDAISRPMRINFDVAGQPIRLHISVTASVGIAVAPGDGVSIATLLTRADSAMYAAKRSGRAAHRFYRADADRASRRLKVSTRLRKAVTSGSLDVEFQPIVDLTASRITGFEALARWNDTQLGPVGPDEFIALAENSPLIDELFDLVLDRSLRAAATWNSQIDAATATPRAKGGELLTVGVNVAARQLRDRTLPNRIVDAAARAGLTPSCVVLELTETALMDDSGRSRAVIGALRDAGIRALIDDYGIGYSNMARLSDLSATGLLDGIKIDRTFVSDLPTDRAVTLLEMFVTMTKALGVSAIAEGIESDEQLTLLTSLGYRFGQGWRFAKPMSADAAARFTLGD